MFLDFNDKYKCKLSTKAIIDCERLLGDNPINVLIRMTENSLPKLGDLLTILWCSMQQFNHGIKKDDIYDIFDEYVENGGSIEKLMEFVVELFGESGLMPKPDEVKEDAEDEERKN